MTNSHGAVTQRILAALDPNRAQTTAEIARKARTTVAIASAILNRLRLQGIVIKRAPWLLVSRSSRRIHAERRRVHSRRQILNR